jgi:uncharacterized protein YxeA
MKKWSKRILGTIVAVLALLVFAFMIWAQFDYDRLEKRRVTSDSSFIKGQKSMQLLTVIMVIN